MFQYPFQCLRKLRRGVVPLLGLWIGLTGCNPSPTTPTATPLGTTVASSVVEARRAAVFNYLSNLSNASSFQGVVSGQNCYHGNEIADNGITVTDEEQRWRNQNGYKRLVEGLFNKTGKWVGILGVDYEFQQLFTPTQLTQANAVLIRYAQANGIVAVTFSPQNPWGNDESDLAKNPGTWDSNRSSTKVEFAPLGVGVSLDDLFDPSKAVNAAWMRKLNRIGTALAQLRDAGVIVLFRPLQEMNGSWFWWGTASNPTDSGPYKRVFQKMRAYFTDTLKLNNLIWVYSPCSTGGGTWIKPVDWAYPGDAFVDIVAGTEYTDTMKIWDYNTYLTLKKPLGMGEFSPADGGAAKDGSWDTSKISTTIRDQYPRIAFWVSWHHYPTQQWDIVSNQNTNTLMNDGLVINRDKFDWTVTQPLLPQVTVTTTTTTVPSGTETMYLRGDINGWGTTSMSSQIVDGNTIWSVTLALGAGTTYLFKFDARGDWSENYGGTEGSPALVLDGANLSFTSSVAGTYVFRLNRTKLTWSVAAL